MSREPTSFDDPSLKRAVMRAWGGEQAPAALRARVEELLRAEMAATASAQQQQQLQQPINLAAARQKRRVYSLIGLAAAAAVLLVVGLLVFQTSRVNPPAGLAANTVPADLTAKLIFRHNACSKAPDHHLFEDAPPDDYALIAKRMGEQLKHPVLAVPLGDGWTFKGAGPCPVGATKSAHLMYANAAQHISVFSLPANFLPTSADHANYDAVVGQQPIAGFVEGGSFYAIVASPGGPTSAELQTIRDTLRSTVVAALQSFETFASAQSR